MRIGSAGESKPDVELVQLLFDRTACAEVDWIDADTVEHLRTWQGADGADWLDLHGVRDLARKRGLRLHGHFDGRPGALDARQTRAVLALFATEPEPPDAVSIAGDEDGEPARRVGVQQAVDAGQWPFDCVLALARPEIEAWQVAAWVPDTADEHSCLSDLSSNLNFDPTGSPERLTSTNDASPRDAKRVLATLEATGRDGQQGLATLPLDQLEHRGATCGLADFIERCRKALIPKLGGTTGVAAPGPQR